MRTRPILLAAPILAAGGRQRLPSSPPAGSRLRISYMKWTCRHRPQRVVIVVVDFVQAKPGAVAVLHNSPIKVYHPVLSIAFQNTATC